MLTQWSPFFFALLLCGSIHAQVLFDNAYTVPGDTMLSSYVNHGLSETSDHEFYFAAGANLDNGPGAPAPFLLAQRTAADGVVVWRRKYFASSGEGFKVYGTKGLLDGSLLTYGSSLDPAPGQAFFFRTDADGLPLAAKWYAQGTESTELHCALPMNDSTILLAGRTSVAGEGLAWWAFADADGDLDTVRYVEVATNTSCQFDHIAPCAGGFILSGTSLHAVDVNTTLRGLTVARIDSTGALVWTRTLEEATPSAFFHARGTFPADMGGFRVFADSRKQGTSHNDVVMISLNDAGDLVWQQRIEFTTYAGGFPTVEALDAGSNLYWLAGGAGNMGRCAAVLHATGLVYSAHTSAVIPDNQDAIDAIRAEDGTLVTFSMWPNPNGVAGDHVPKLTKDNVVPVACSPTALSRTAMLGDFTLDDTWTTGTLTYTAMDLLGEVSTQLDDVEAMTICLSTSLEEGVHERSLTVTPVPTTGEVTIRGNAIDHVQLIDAQGRVLRSLTCQPSPTVYLALEGLAPGMYLLRLHEHTLWQTLRIVKE